MGSVGPPERTRWCMLACQFSLEGLWRGACVGDRLRGGARSDALLLLLLRRNDGSAAAGREKTERIAPGLPESEHEFF
jgi:hypothetical protein